MKYGLVRKAKVDSNIPAIKLEYVKFHFHGIMMLQRNKNNARVSGLARIPTFLNNWMYSNVNAINDSWIDTFFFLNPQYIAPQDRSINSKDTKRCIKKDGPNIFAKG